MNDPQSSRIVLDPLSDVLSALGARLFRRTRFTASGNWAFAYPAGKRLKFVALMRGRCWLSFPDRPPQMLTGGDVYLLGDTAYSIASDPDLSPIDGMPLFAHPDGDAVQVGDGNEVVLLSGGIKFDHDDAAFVLEALPAFIWIDRHSPSATAVARTLTLIDSEVADNRPGTSLITTRLAEILLVEAIRAYVAVGDGDRVGWIGALADRQIGAALRLMHGDVARRWTLGVLASRVGMSRSAFSARFTTRVGRSPLEYLTYWRMVLAQRLLREDYTSIADVAREVGYSSQGAFAHAFKRELGHSPRFGLRLIRSQKVTGVARATAERKLEESSSGQVEANHPIVA